MIDRFTDLVLYNCNFEDVSVGTGLAYRVKVASCLVCVCLSGCVHVLPLIWESTQLASNDEYQWHQRPRVWRS